MVYKAVHIVLNDPGDADLLAGLLSPFSFEGFEEQDGLLIGYITATDMPAGSELEEALKNFSYQVKEVPDQNWNAVWESHFQPVLVADFCGIRADFHPSFQTVQHEIVINPRMSFGTGHHATTQMMIRLMQSLELKGKKVLDFGTGTGILSILAGKMGAKKTVAIDHDPNAVENAFQNIKENATSDITLYRQDHPDVGESNFDVVLANINRNVILNVSESLVKQLKPGGFLLLSGFLRKDRAAIENAFYRQGFLTEKMLEDKEWTALRLHFKE